MRSVARFVLHTCRAVRTVATDRRIPRVLRLLVVAGALPIPGPFDEALLLVAAGPLFIFYRPIMREAWRDTADSRLAKST